MTTKGSVNGHVEIAWEEAVLLMVGRMIVVTQSSFGFQTRGIVEGAYIDGSIVRLTISNPKRRRHPARDAFEACENNGHFWVGVGCKVFKTQSGTLYICLPFAEHATIGD